MHSTVKTSCDENIVHSLPRSELGSWTAILHVVLPRYHIPCSRTSDCVVAQQTRLLRAVEQPPARGNHCLTERSTSVNYVTLQARPFQLRRTQPALQPRPACRMTTPDLPARRRSHVIHVAPPLLQNRFVYIYA